MGIMGGTVDNRRGMLGGDSGQRLSKLTGVVGSRTVGYGGVKANPNAKVVKPNFYPVITGDEGPFDPSHLLSLAPILIIFGSNYFASRLPDSKCWLVWDKMMSPENTFSDAELIWTNMEGHVRMYKHRWSGLVRAGNRDEELLKRVHPTQKPVGLLVQILEDFSKKGQLILDPYGGSGSTLIACEKLGRKCRMMEIEPFYCDVIIRRWEDFTGHKAELVGG